MKNILALMHDDSGQEARYQVALDVTRALEGHLTCLDLTYIPPMTSGIYESAYVMVDLLTQESTREEANRARMKSRLEHEDVSWNWVDVTGHAAQTLRQAATLADLIIVNRRLEDPATIDMRRTASELVVQSGKPVLAVPASCQRLSLDAAMIAWDGSICAAAAMRAAVPLLQKTRHVVLVELQDGSIAAPAEEAASYLSRHGIPTLVERSTCRHGEAGERLIETLGRGGFGYLVMGGFGHARFIEALFGGVTRTMLNKSPVPVFLAH